MAVVTVKKQQHIQAWGSKPSLAHPQIDLAKYFCFSLGYLFVKKQEHKNLWTDFHDTWYWGVLLDFDDKFRLLNRASITVMVHMKP
jgi:hypothetical protein